MLYIITEDENSARDFFECVAYTFKNSNEFTLVPLITKNGGNTTLKEQVKSVLRYVNYGDKIMIVFDNIEDTTNFVPAEFIKWLGIKCKEANVNYRITKYYCFEELYLSYDELIDMYVHLDKANKCVVEALKYVHYCINNNINYFNDDSRIQNFVNMRKEAGVNREHFALQLLIKATEIINGYFRIIKQTGALKNQGKCWIETCNDIQRDMMNEHKVHNICVKNCLYCCKNKDTKDKLIDLNNRSLFRKSKIQLYQI